MKMLHLSIPNIDILRLFDIRKENFPTTLFDGRMIATVPQCFLATALFNEITLTKIGE